MQSILRHCLLILGSLSVVGCGNSDLESITQTGLVYCSEGSPDSFNPHIGTSSINFDASARVLFDRLFEFGDNGSIKPSLAVKVGNKPEVSIEDYVSEDGLTYTIPLRSDVEFHSNRLYRPTRSLNATDVIFTFKRQQNEDNPFHNTGSTEYSYFKSTGLKENLASVYAKDSHTVVFQLRKADPNFINYLAMEFTSIISKQYADFIQNNEIDVVKFDSEPIGTGPFKFRRYEPNAFIRYVAHDDYWIDGEPALKHLVFAITPDPAVRYARLISEECDVIAQPLSSHLPLITANPELIVQRQAGLNMGFWAFNTQKPPLHIPEVRKALSMAINRARILESVYSGMGVLSNTPLPATMPYHNDSLEDISYDPERARNLLREAGFEDGFEIDIWPIPGQKSYMPDARLAAILMQDDLSKIGVTLTIKGEGYQQSTFLNEVSNGAHDTAILGWVADNFDAGDFMGTLLSCDARINRTNRTFWCNPDFDDLLSNAKAARNNAIRANLYNQAQQLFRDDLPLVPIASGQRIQVIHQSVENMQLSPTGLGISFREVRKNQS